MAKKKKAKFKVGQVVWWFGLYARVVSISHTTLPPMYQITPDGLRHNWVNEDGGVRPLTKRERGEARKG